MRFSYWGHWGYAIYRALNKKSAVLDYGPEFAANLLLDLRQAPPPLWASVSSMIKVGAVSSGPVQLLDANQQEGQYHLCTWGWGDGLATHAGLQMRFSES